MIPAGYSKYVIYSCINMSYAPRQSRAQSKTSQSCSRPAAAVSAFTRRRLPYGAGQRSFAAPGLSLSATSSASEAAASGQRYQSRFHRQAFSPIGEASSDSCPGGRLVLERVREPGVSGATNAETRAWLSGVPSAANFSSNIYLIVCCRISWNRFISCWSPTVPARLVVLALLCLRRICMTQAAAIYTRVSSDRQKEEHTIASQTAALMEYAQKHSYVVPPEWVFQDEGYSGATLIRPGLEALRDLAAQGQVVAVLVYSPDRLSRKYAYQVLLAEEFSRCGVNLVFLQSPAGNTAEDQLVVQLQGMIAEYECAQIAERSRREKRHKAQQGVVNVLSGAPYGYHYVKKSDASAGYYQVVEAEAQVVRWVFAMYTQQQLSLNAMARQLNQRQILTRSGKVGWRRQTIWHMLRNPAYRGTACYGKTDLQPRPQSTRFLRQRKRSPHPDTVNRERPRNEWIEVSVPALVEESVFALAQEQLQKNQHFSPRRTKRPCLLQGLLVCQQCGYARYGTSGGKPQHRLYYYRCQGADGYRWPQGTRCTNRPVRQDYLDQIIWAQIIALLEDEKLIQSEIDRRRETAGKTDPCERRKEILRSEQARLRNKMERLITAYQDGLLSLEQLRERMPNLKQQSQAVNSELQLLEMEKLDQAKYLKLAESLGGFRNKLRARAQTLDVKERQQVLRLLVKEILVGLDTLTIRHSIPIPSGDEPPPNIPGSTPSPQSDYPLRPRSIVAVERKVVVHPSRTGHGHKL